MTKNASTPPSPFHPLPAAGAGPARRQRVCIASFDFVGPIRNGGVGTAFTSLGEALAAAGHEVTLLYLSSRHCETSEPLEHWVADYRAKGIAFVPLPECSGPRLQAPWHMAKSFEAYEWLRQREFDVVHFSEWRAPGYYALQAKHQGLAFARTLLCVHAHGPTLWSLLSNGEYISRMEELELDFMERESVRRADVLVSPSQYLLRWMQERDWVLPAATFVQQYVRPASAHPAAAGNAGAAPVTELVFFGRLEIRKGVVLFCDALDRLRDDPALRELRVTFLGKAARIDGIESAAYLRERMARWPWKCEIITDRNQPDALAYLQQAGRLAVIPSMVDNLPNTVLECLGGAVPFLASTTGGIPEMIPAEDSGEFLFPLRAPAVAEMLRRAANAGVRPARFAVDPEANRRAWIDWHSRATAPAHAPAATGEPRVSICLSHFNRPEFLRQTLESIEAQTYRNFEVVLVDDASTRPEAVAYLDALEPQFAAKGWQLIRNREEIFAGAARNLAARRARGEYLKFLDDDNVAKPHELSTFVQVALRTGADTVSCALDFFSGDEAPAPNLKPNFRFLFLGPAASAGALRNYFGDTNSMFRREVFLKLGGFHEQVRVGHEDWKLLSQIVLQGYQLEVIPDALVWYRRTETGENATALNSSHGGHMQNIQPYLDVVPAALRNLVWYAQGVALRGEEPEEVELLPYVQHTVRWRSKLEAGRVLAQLGQTQAAISTMLQGVKAVQSCGVPRIVLDALMGIAEQLMPLDPGRARYLLESALKLAQSHRRTREADVIRKLLAPGNRTSAAALTAAR